MSNPKFIIDRVVEAEEEPKFVSSDTGRWYYDDQGRLHRLTGPAVINAKGTPRWYTNGENEYWVHGQRLAKHEFFQFLDQETGTLTMPFNYKREYDKDGNFIESFSL
jgi:hypothetical protein